MADPFDRYATTRAELWHVNLACEPFEPGNVVPICRVFSWPQNDHRNRRASSREPVIDPHLLYG
jgi:hypothetical protein